MGFTEIDKNFTLKKVKETDIKWYDAKDGDFSVFGVFYDTEDKAFRRVPKRVAEKVSFAFEFLSTNTSGGTLRFQTDSPYIALKCTASNCGLLGNMSVFSQCGFSLYLNGAFSGVISPVLPEILRNSTENIVPKWEESQSGKTDYSFDGILYTGKNGICEVEIDFPLYGNVKDLYIGLKDGSKILKPTAYKTTAPVCFYGSSITQGGGASRPGNEYVGLLSKMLNAEVLNLGFSGNCLGEQAVANYISGLKISVFVLDYDYNAPTVEHLKNTHYAFYKTVCSACPNLPIVIMTRPCGKKFDLDRDERKKVILATYEKAKADGDENVYFVDGSKAIKESKFLNNTVDGVHPNDVGFLNMAKALYPVLKKLI